MAGAFGNSYTPNDLRYSFSGSDCRAFAFYPNQHKLRDYLLKKIEKFEKYILYITDDPGWQQAVKANENLKGKQEKVKKNLADTAQMIKTNQSLGIDPPVFNDATFENQEKERVEAQKEVDKQYKAMEKRGEHHKLANTRLEIKRVEKGKEQLQALANGFSGGDYAELESLATISISIHEPKGMVRRLGHRNIVGFSRSTRTIAGTMIFTVIDNHPLTKLMALDPQSILETGQVSGTKLKWMVDEMLGVGTSPDLALEGDGESRTWVRTATDLAPFHLVLNYMSEYQGGQILAAHDTMAGARNQKLSEILKRQTKLKQLMATQNQALKDLDSKLKPKTRKNHRQEGGGGHDHTSSGHEAWTDEQKAAAIAAKQRQKELQTEHGYLEKTRQGILAKQSIDATQDGGDQDLKISMMLEHVEFISQGIVTSVHDMVSEISIQFVAANVYEMAGSGLNGLSAFDNITKILQQFAYAAHGGEFGEEFQQYGHPYEGDLGQDFQHVSGQNVRGKTSVQLIMPPDVKPANNKLVPYTPSEEFADKMVYHTKPAQ